MVETGSGRRRRARDQQNPQQEKKVAREPLVDPPKSPENFAEIRGNRRLQIRFKATFRFDTKF